MPLDPRAKRFLDALAATAPPSALSLAIPARRSALASLLSMSGEPEPIGASEDGVLPGSEAAIAVRIYTPAVTTAAILPALVYFHGGGLVAGTITTHDGISRALCNASGCRLIAVGYRLAPEHRFPAGLEDAYSACVYVAAHAHEFGADPARIGIVGDSAGGTLAAVVCERLAREAHVRPTVQCLICPILEHAEETASRRELAEGYLLDRATLAHDLLHYLPPGVDPADPRVSPLRATDLRHLPTSLVHTAEYDPLRDEGRTYTERLRAADVAVRYTCHPGMIHLFYGLLGVIPYARTALTRIGAELREAMR